MRILVVSAIVVAVVLLVAGQTPSSIDVPKLSTELDRFGARPGTFHFVTNEQTMSDAKDLKDAVAALDRLDGATAKLDPRVRLTLQPDLRVVRDFALNVHSRRIGSAGPKAAEVESRLDDAKGNYMCGACHGHSMMHGRPMQ